MRQEQIWKFETKSFRVIFEVSPEDDLDLSWDETGETREKLDDGIYCAFVAHVKVVHKPTGATLGEDYLGSCIYESPRDFMDHYGLAAKSRADGCNYGSYFHDMVREAITAARKEAQTMKAIKLRAA